MKACEILKYGICRRKLPKVAESDNLSIDAWHIWHSRHRPAGKVSAACGALFGGLLADLMARCGQYNIIQLVISWTDGHNQSKFGRCFKQRFGILVVLHRNSGRRATFQHPSRCLPSHGRILVAQAVVLSLFFISFHFLSIFLSHFRIILIYFVYFGTILASGQSLAKLRIFFREFLRVAVWALAQLAQSPGFSGVDSPDEFLCYEGSALGKRDFIQIKHLKSFELIYETYSI